ncbi:ATP-dependent DNA helicase [Sphingomonas montanisoli]|uniref:ATP-dependent DNA helicase n=1 Tax=Sphingomonas montanisoli TaxID=2606412 RepID=A0A5D9CAV3_9SPHN|nr:ATP-dependent DNA helicase [Sphingomonas montanisoli]TZG28924.1 ATP-dependent DNA helicase [Sphingomonas montanisoli]
MPPPLPYSALHATHAGIWIASPDGHVRAVGRGEATSMAADMPMIMLNAPLVSARLGLPELLGLDLLELFAFVHPARFAVPTPAGIARALDLDPPVDEASSAALLLKAAQALLERVEARDSWAERDGAWNSAQSLARLRWPWVAALGKVLREPAKPERGLFARLPEWDEEARRPPPRAVLLDEHETLDRLSDLVGPGAESREGQRQYAAAAARAFDPRIAEGKPNLVLAEAGTGIGKTLGYLAPATLWAHQAQGGVWISTYTKALQRQLDKETRRAFPDPAARAGKVVIRKGRENYLCLLNLEDALQGGFQNRAAILAQLVARWARYSRDGDMVGGDMPGWLPTLFRRAGSTALTDRRGECVYAGCPHYRKCFIERAARASEQADIVIANHALVMILAQRRADEGAPIGRIIFDEGHHIFDAADSTFAAALTGQEAIELRRWIIGPEAKSRGRRRGLSARLSDIASYDEEGGLAIDAAATAATLLPGDGWLGRLGEDLPQGPIERLLAAVRAAVLARADAADAGYGLETDANIPPPMLIDAAQPAIAALEGLMRPMAKLRQRLVAIMDDAPDWLDGQARARVEGAIAGLVQRGQTVAAWVAMLARLGGPVDPDFVDWLAVDRVEGREFDIGLHRHWLDPSRPFAETVLKPAQGAVITSATLRDGEDWTVAEARSGAAHLDARTARIAVPSPFDYAAHAEVLIVNDLKRGDVAQLGQAYHRLIAAAGGGTLGLFTAISRLRAVHARIADRLARDGLPIYAQHVDPIDTGTLVDIFRDDPRASLLGTDALRDGVDVPGDSLRLVVMEGVPWPRPTVLHSARKMAGGGSAYDDRIVRARLRQAFGRLIRSAGDRGHFVLLGAATPSRLLDAFPGDVPVLRVTLDEAVARIAAAQKARGADFLSSHLSGTVPSTGEETSRS